MYIFNFNNSLIDFIDLLTNKCLFQKFYLVWRDSYKEAIKIVRDSGWGGPIVVDASDYAQNPDGKCFLLKILV
jgi:hypothetical protein